jgi:hypothetical protein
VLLPRALLHDCPVHTSLPQNQNPIFCKRIVSFLTLNFILFLCFILLLIAKWLSTYISNTYDTMCYCGAYIEEWWNQAN